MHITTLTMPNKGGLVTRSYYFASFTALQATKEFDFGRLLTEGEYLDVRNLEHAIIDNFWSDAPSRLGKALQKFLKLRDNYCLKPGVFVLWYESKKDNFELYISFIEATKTELIELTTSPNKELKKLGERLAASHTLLKDDMIAFLKGRM